MKQIIAFSGSNSNQSINKQLVEYTLTHFQHHDNKLLDLNDFEMPIYSMDREKIGFPEKVFEFRKHIESADAIICSLAEHNNSYTTAFKNILDWSSRVDQNVFFKKPMLLMSTSTGGYGGGNVMQAAKNYFPKCGGVIISTFSLPSFRETFKQGKIIHSEQHEHHLNAIINFKEYLSNL